MKSKIEKRSIFIYLTSVPKNILKKINVCMKLVLYSAENSDPPIVNFRHHIGSLYKSLTSVTLIRTRCLKKVSLETDLRGQFMF